MTEKKSLVCFFSKTHRFWNAGKQSCRLRHRNRILMGYCRCYMGKNANFSKKSQYRVFSVPYKKISHIYIYIYIYIYIWEKKFLGYPKKPEFVPVFDFRYGSAVQKSSKFSRALARARYVQKRNKNAREKGNAFEKNV